jgi:hypothetical protein
MQSRIPLLVTDPLPMIQDASSLSEESADSLEIHFDPNYSEYDLMANRQYKEKHYSQELKLETSPVSNAFMPYRYHMESYKTLVIYAQTHPKANEYLKEVTKDSIAKMVRFTTESGMVECVAGGDTKSNTSTIKHRPPHAMGVPLRIVSSRQGTQKKKRYSHLRSKAETAKRRKEQRKHYERHWVDCVVHRDVHWVNYIGYDIG